MTHDAKPHMKYTAKELVNNKLLRAAVLAQEPVEDVLIRTWYATTSTRERGWEFIRFV